LLVIFVTQVATANDGQQPQPVKKQGIRLDGRRIEVVIDALCRAQVKVTCRLTNATDEPMLSRQHFSALLMPWRPADEKAFHVRIDGRPVEGKVEVARFASRARAEEGGRTFLEPIPRPTKEQTENWSRMLDEWTRRDPELRNLMERYGRLSSVEDRLNALTRAFDDQVAKHLIHEDLRYAARAVASGDSALHHLVKLMPEVDASLRFDINFQRWKYLSYLDEFDPDSYRPYQQPWQRKAATWFQSKPKLAQLTPKLREAWESHREAHKLLNGEIVKLLHDQCGLSHEDALVLRDYYASPTFSRPATVDLLKKLFLEVRRERSEFTTEVLRRMSRSGFDTMMLSAITGKLYPAVHEQRRGFPNLWHDPTVKAGSSTIGKRRSSADSETVASTAPKLPPMGFWQAVGRPHLLTLDVPLAAKAHATVVIEYEVPVQTLQHPLSATIGFAGGVSQLVVVLDPATRAGAVDVSISLPRGLHPVISPPPEKITSGKDGRRFFTAGLRSPRQNLHMALIDFRTPQAASAYLARFRADGKTLDSVKRLHATTKNPSVQPLLKAAQYQLLLREGRGLEAHKLLLQFQRTDPDFVGFAGLQKQSESSYLAREAKQLYEWIQLKSSSPQYEGDDDFSRFQSRSRNDSNVLKPAALAELAKNVHALKDADLSPKERLGRRFVLCQAGIEPRENLAKLLRMADFDRKLTQHVLRLIQAMTVEKPDALPFVLEQIADAKQKKKRVATTDPAWQKLHAKYNAGYHALRTFRSPQAAPRIIEFIRSTDADSLLIQGAVSALGHMTLPDLFDDLIEVSGPVARSSVSAFYQYLDLLIRSQPDESVAALRRLRREYPKYASRISFLLSEQGDRLELPAAIEAYNTSTDRDRLAAAVQSLQSFGDPMVIGRLKYRHGLEKWMNESVLNILRRKGGDPSAYPFVEKFYHEFVKGRKASHHLDCVAAFEAIGDPRAIPYLKEIIQTTEGKRGAVRAVGKLMLPLRTKRRRDTRVHEFSACVYKVQDPHTTPEEWDAALKTLLEDPQASMEIIMRHGRVRDLLSGDSSSAWQAEDEDRLKYLSRFGDIAARRFLEAARGCSLTTRYQLAHLFNLLPAESRNVLCEAASNPAADLDQRRMAILALGRMRDPQAVTILGDLAEHELLLGNVIDALTNIGNTDAIRVLQKLKRQLEMEDGLTPRREVWLSKIKTE